MRHRDGSYRWLSTRDTVFAWDTDGRPRQILGAAQDISKLKRTTDSLAAREALLRSITDTAGAGFYMIGLDGRYSYANPAYLTMVGLEPRDITGEHISDLIGPERFAQMKPWQDRAIAGECVSFERTGAVPGATRPYVQDRLVYLQPHWHDGGIAGFIGVVVDITGRKRTERALAESERQARAQTAEIASIYDSARIGLCVLDLDLRFQRINERLAEINGISVAGHIGKTLREIVPDFAEQAERLAAQIIETGKGAVDIEFSGTTPARPGVTRYWIGQWLPLKDHAGQATGINVVIEEVTERKHAEEGLRRHAARLALLLNVTSDLIAASEPQSLGRIVFERVGPAFGADVCFNYRVDDASGRLQLVFESGLAAEQRELAAWLDVNQAFCGTVAADCQPILADRARIASDPKGVFIRDAGLTAYSCHPLRATSGRVLGTFSLGSTSRDAFSEDEHAWLGTVANFLSQAWERFEAEQELRQSEQRLRAASEAARFGIHDMDVARGTTLWSAELVRLLGRGDGPRVATIDEALSTLHPAGRETTGAEMQTILRRPGPYEVECRIQRPDGETRWLLDRGQAIGPLDPVTGLVARVTGTVIDITDRKRSEDVLRRHSERQALLLKVTSDLIVASDAAAAARQVFEHVASEFDADVVFIYRLEPEQQKLEMVFDRGIPPQRRAEAQCIKLNQAFCGLVASSGNILVADAARIGTDPAGAFVRELGVKDFVCHPLRGTGGNVLGTFALGSSRRERFSDDDVAWLATVVNVLAQSWERITAEQAVREREQRLQIAMSGAGLAAWDRDLVSGRNRWDDRVAALLGIDPATSADASDGWRSRIVAEDRTQVVTAFDAAAAGGPPFDVEFRVDGADGVRRWLASRGTVVKHEGRPVRMIGVVQDITARKEAAEDQVRLAAIVTSSADAIVSKSLDGTIMTWNAGAEHMFGYTAAEMIGQSIRRLLPGDRQAEEDDILARVARGERIEHHETIRHRKDGHPIEVSVTISPLRDVAGRITAASKIIRDITERKASEQRLQLRTAELETLLTSAPLGLAYFDRQHRYVRVNDELAEINGIAAADHIGRSVAELLPANAPTIDPIIERVFETGDIISDLELSGETPREPGTQRYWLTGFFPVRGPSGRIELAGTWVTEISERKRFELALKNSEQRFRATFENAAVGVALVAPDGRFLRVNDSLARIVGYTLAELSAKTFQDITHPDDLDADLAQVQSILTGEIDTYQMDKRYLRKDGSTVWGRLTVGCVRKSDRAVEYFISVIEDITERKGFDLERAIAIERAEVAQLAAGAMHYEFLPATGDVIRTPAFTQVTGYGVDEVPGTGEAWRSLIHPDDLARAWPLIEEGIATGNGFALDYRIRHKAGHSIWCHDRARILKGAQGEPDRVIGMVIDISERKAREEHIHLLMREVNHRAKNILSVVQAIARQTVSSSPTDFIARFGERIQALSANQDLLVRNDWQGVDVGELVRAQLAPFEDIAGTRISMSGPNLRLTAAAAQGIGLALHELATNANKYGALSCKNGRIEIAWRADQDQFAIEWIERDGPQVRKPARRGFGSTVIATMAKLSVDGAVNLDFAPAGLTWRLVCPAYKALESGGDIKKLPVKDER